MLLPVRNPRVYVAIPIASNRMIPGSLKKSRIFLPEPVCGKISGKRVLAISNITGSRDDKKLLAVPGNWSSGLFFAYNPSRGELGIFFNVRENKGPAIMIAGIAIV